MLEQIIFYLLLVDSIGANIVSFFGTNWYTKKFNVFAKYFPAKKSWALLYLALVLWIGYLTFNK